MYKLFVDDMFVMETNTVKYAKIVAERSFMDYDAWIFKGNKSYCTKDYKSDWHILQGIDLRTQEAKYSSYLSRRES